jgi:hypothetical protein
VRHPNIHEKNLQHKSLLLSVKNKVIGIIGDLYSNAQHKYASKSIGCGHYTTQRGIMQEEKRENGSLPTAVFG